MNKKYLNISLMLCGVAVLFTSLFLIKDNILHAEEGQEITDTIEDGANDEESNQQEEGIIPLDMQTITLTIHEAQNTIIPDLSVKINGVEYSYYESDFVDNVLTLDIDDSSDQMIELSSNQYYFDPSYIMVNQANLQGNYDFEAYAGNAPDATEEAVVYGADGVQKEQYENDETVTVSISAKNPLHRVFYKIENDEWKMSESDLFTVTSRQSKEHEVLVSYYVEYFNSSDQEPSIDNFNEPNNPTELTIKFAAAKDNDSDNDNNSNPDNPDEPIVGDQDEASFIGEDGNTYTKDEIKLTVEEMDAADYEKYQRVIKYYDEFKNIPAAQITYYQAALYAQDVRVQPNELYSLLLPYPANTSADNEFVIYQFKDGNTDHAALLDYTADSSGLHVSVNNVSAFIVGWKEADKTVPTDKDENENAVLEKPADIETTTSGGVNTGDATNIIIWVSLLCGSYLYAMISIRKKAKNYYE